MPLTPFHSASRLWFESSFTAPTPVQAQGWTRIASGEHALLIAPTGSGKTLAAFFWCIDRLSRLDAGASALADGSGVGAKRALPARSSADEGRNTADADAETVAADGLLHESTANETARARALTKATAHHAPVPPRSPGVRVLYVSPLKALVYDIERNLRAPLIGVQRAAERLGIPVRMPRVAVRTGDTPQRERAEQTRDPAEILVTTPESLYLILGSAQRETLRSVEWIIVDEIHALAPTKRGAHLALSLERVAALCGREPQRIGLSATARPLAEVARFLGGDRPVSIVDTSAKPRLDVEIVVPVPDMTRPVEPLTPAGGALPISSSPFSPTPRRKPDLRTKSILAELAAKDAPDPSLGLWPAIYPRLLEQVLAHRSTIVFVNSRGLCERLCQRLNELAGEEILLAHHGSVAHEQRREIEEALKAGRIRGIVATSSLELGIDMGAVDLVLLVESPGAVSRGLQRVGRAGHQVGEVSKGRLYPKHRGDLLEATVVSHGMEEGAVEAIHIPRNPLDVLAQQIVAMCGQASWKVDELERVVRRAANFRDLSREALVAVLDMLAGRYPSTEFAELRPRIVWDRETDVLTPTRGAGKLSLLSGGTIPDRGLYHVHVAPDGPRVGELDEEMVFESRPGQTITLGASTWRITEITRDRVLVVPAPGEPGRLPFWRGEGPGRPIELGRALGAFVRELDAKPREEAEQILRTSYHLDEFAARNLLDHLAEQRAATGALPTDRAITIERFRDELGDWRVCILSPFGARVHSPWALALEARLSAEAGFDVQALASDDGIVLRFADAETLPDVTAFLPDPEEIEDLVVEQLGHSALFAASFRENAARALLLPRRRPGARTPLWVQRLKSQNLLSVARQFPSFPIILETYRTCLQDVFDLPGLQDLLRRVRAREVRVDEAETPSASPFARSLVFAYTAAYLYQGDSPAAERRAQALLLDRNMLRDLLGEEQLRDLLDAGAIDAVESEMQQVAESARVSHPDALVDLLRRIGDLSQGEIAARCESDPSEWIDELVARRRILAVRIAGEPRFVAAEDAALYRDALGTALPSGLAAALLEPVAEPVEQLLLRFARTHGPFTPAAAAKRFGMVSAQAEAVLSALEARGKLLSGEFHPHGREREWVDAEVLRRIRRRTMAKLRGEVAAVEPRVLARFLPNWHGIGAEHGGARRLDEAIAQLEGLPLPFSDLERAILPARVRDFEPRMLDERGAMGQIVWVGQGALGERDGKIALYRRDRAGLLVETSPVPDELGAVHRAMLERLEQRGASFFAELLQAAGPATEREVQGALWDLVWAGLVTNDTFAPLRALAVRGETRKRGKHAPTQATGRWSLVSTLAAPNADATRRAHARAVVLLDRWGVVARDALGVEAIAGGFSAVYPVLRAMEEAGKIRRGHFVDGLGGAQFAFAGAVDQLRAARATPPSPEAVLLAASDPANAYGAMLPWPEPRPQNGGQPRRAAGATVVLVDGELALFLDRNARHLVSFPSIGSGEALARAVGALRSLLLDRRRRALRIERIDGEPALDSPLRALFEHAGFRAEYKGLALDRYAAEVRASRED
ncbi:MAG: DEAD/DEAH box helicase [Proteobacteria bacterium]|nr:MAG: DEAD/DEAH box helicase [Pseudomonadota bacterium]